MSPPASKRKAAPPARARSLLTAAALAIIAYAASAAEPAWSLLALACSALAVLVTSPLVGITVPRAVTGLATLGVLLLTLSRAADNGLDVHDFAGFVVWMIVVKCFDRRTAGDDAQLLAFAIFLAVASMLLSNGLVVAMLTLVFLPFVAYAAMHLQLRVSRDRAQRLARHKAADPARVPGIRPASGPATGAALARTSVIALGVGFMFAALVFVVVPRGAGLRQLGRLGNPSAGRVVSFTDRVRVGAGGAIATSRTPVLHLRVTDADGRDLGGVGAVRYLRGAVLEDYEDGTWTVSHTPARDGQIDEFLAEQSKSFGTGSSNSIITQELLLLNTPREFTYLFTLWRPNDIRVGDPCTVAVYSPHGSIMAATNGGKFRYTVRSSQADPYATRARARSPTGWPSPTVARIAAEILAPAGIHPDPATRPIEDDARAITEFRQFFWDNYEYSLGEPPPPPGVEPIDWFLTQTDRGHCEHYAAGLAALCRSVGIPARVVTGYLAAEYTRATGNYIVRESNAHAWVEAQVEPGIWRTYDATPPQEIMRLHGPRPGVLAGLGRVLDAINYKWVNSIVSFDSAARGDLLRWSEPATGEISDKAGVFFKHLRLAAPGEIVVLAIRLFLIMTAVVFGVYGLGVLARRWLRIRARRPAALPGRIDDPAVRGRVRDTPLYQDLLTTLARAGLRKPEWQPLADWGRSLEPRSAELAATIRELAGLFYIIRYGGRDLRDQEHARARELLARVSRIAAARETG
jgi:transglutaminase-like putative cysteine protease